MRMHVSETWKIRTAFTTIINENLAMTSWQLCRRYWLPHKLNVRYWNQSNLQKTRSSSINLLLSIEILISKEKFNSVIKFFFQKMPMTRRVNRWVCGALHTAKIKSHRGLVLNRKLVRIPIQFVFITFYTCFQILVYNFLIPQNSVFSILKTIFWQNGPFIKNFPFYFVSARICFFGKFFFKTLHFFSIFRKNGKSILMKKESF